MTIHHSIEKKSLVGSSVRRTSLRWRSMNTIFTQMVVILIVLVTASAAADADPTNAATSTSPEATTNTTANTTSSPPPPTTLPTSPNSTEFNPNSTSGGTNAPQHGDGVGSPSPTSTTTTAPPSLPHTVPGALALLLPSALPAYTSDIAASIAIVVALFGGVRHAGIPAQAARTIALLIPLRCGFDAKCCDFIPQNVLGGNGDGSWFFILQFPFAPPLGASSDEPLRYLLGGVVCSTLFTVLLVATLLLLRHRWRYDHARRPIIAMQQELLHLTQESAKKKKESTARTSNKKNKNSSNGEEEEVDEVKKEEGGDSQLQNTEEVQRLENAVENGYRMLVSKSPEPKEMSSQRAESEHDTNEEETKSAKKKKKQKKASKAKKKNKSAEQSAGRVSSTQYRVTPHDPWHPRLLQVLSIATSIDLAYFVPLTIRGCIQLLMHGGSPTMAVPAAVLLLLNIVSIAAVGAFLVHPELYEAKGVLRETGAEHTVHALSSEKRKEVEQWVEKTAGCASGSDDDIDGANSSSSEEASSDGDGRPTMQSRNAEKQASVKKKKDKRRKKGADKKKTKKKRTKSKKNGKGKQKDGDSSSDEKEKEVPAAVLNPQSIKTKQQQPQKSRARGPPGTNRGHLITQNFEILKVSLKNTIIGSNYVEAFGPGFLCLASHHPNTAGTTRGIKQRLYCLEEILVATVMNIIAGIQPALQPSMGEGTSSSFSCNMMAYLLLVVGVLHTVYVAIIRPYRTKIAMIVAASNCGASLVLAMMTIAATTLHSKDNPEPIGVELGLAVAVQLLLLIGQSIAVIGWSWCYVTHRRRSRRRVLGLDSNTDDFDSDVEDEQKRIVAAFRTLHGGTEREANNNLDKNGRHHGEWNGEDGEFDDYNSYYDEHEGRYDDLYPPTNSKGRNGRHPPHHHHRQQRQNDARTSKERQLRGASLEVPLLDHHSHNDDERYYYYNESDFDDEEEEEEEENPMFDPPEDHHLLRAHRKPNDQDVNPFDELDGKVPADRMRQRRREMSNIDRINRVLFFSKDDQRHRDDDDKESSGDTRIKNEPRIRSVAQRRAKYVSPPSYDEKQRRSEPSKHSIYAKERERELQEDLWDEMEYLSETSDHLRQSMRHVDIAFDEGDHLSPRQRREQQFQLEKLRRSMTMGRRDRHKNNSPQYSYSVGDSPDPTTTQRGASYRDDNIVMSKAERWRQQRQQRRSSSKDESKGRKQYSSPTAALLREYVDDHRHHHGYHHHHYHGEHHDYGYDDDSDYYLEEHEDYHRHEREQRGKGRGAHRFHSRKQIAYDPQLLAGVTTAAELEEVLAGGNPFEKLQLESKGGITQEERDAARLRKIREEQQRLADAEQARLDDLMRRPRTLPDGSSPPRPPTPPHDPEAARAKHIAKQQERSQGQVVDEKKKPSQQFFEGLDDDAYNRRYFAAEVEMDERRNMAKEEALGGARDIAHRGNTEGLLITVIEHPETTREQARRAAQQQRIARRRQRVAKLIASADDDLFERAMELAVEERLRLDFEDDGDDDGNISDDDDVLEYRPSCGHFR